MVVEREREGRRKQEHRFFAHLLAHHLHTTVAQLRQNQNLLRPSLLLDECVGVTRVRRIGGSEENRVEGGGAGGRREDGERKEGGGDKEEDATIGGGDEEQIVVEGKRADGGVVEYRGGELLQVKQETE